MNDSKEKKLNEDVVINIQKTVPIDENEKLNNKNCYNDTKKRDIGYIYFIYFNLFFLILAVIFDIYKFFHNLKNSTYNWLYIIIKSSNNDTNQEVEYKYPGVKFLQLILTVIVILCLSAFFNFILNSLIKIFPKAMLWFSRSLLSLILLGISIVFIFVLRLPYTSVIGVIILTIGFAIEENNNSNMGYAIELLNEYIEFSNKSNKCNKLGIYGNIWGKIVIGIFISSVFMLVIPTPNGSFPVESINSYGTTIYKFREEYFAYMYNFGALIMAVFFLYISTKFFMNVISCTISGTYAKLNLSKYYDNNQKQDQDSLIRYYLEKSFKMCYGTIVAQPINHIWTMIKIIFKTLFLLLFGLPFYIFVIFLNFLPVFIALIFLNHISFSIVLLILIICFVLSYIFSYTIYNNKYKLKMKYLNFLNIILENKSFDESYKKGLIFPDVFTIPQQQEIPFYEFFRLHKSVTSPFPIKLMRFFCALLTTIFITGITILINMLFTKAISGLIIFATAITEFLTSLIYFHPYVSGTQAIAKCNWVKERLDNGDNDSECDYEVEYETDNDDDNDDDDYNYKNDDNDNDNSDDNDNDYKNTYNNNYNKIDIKNHSITDIENDNDASWN